MASVKTAAQKAARESLWLQGDLFHKLDPCKREIYGQIKNCNSSQFLIESCRKLGKSYLWCLIAIETALKNPGGRINYACPTASMAREIVVPIMEEIQRDAPASCRASFNKQEGHWTWPNGAYMVLFGCEDELKADRGRGPAAILSIVDEGAFIPVLMYVVESVLAPQHLRSHLPLKILIGSTPPKSPDHPFCKLADAAMKTGSYAHRDIYSPGIAGIPDPESFIEERAQTRGMSTEEYKQTSDFKREYLGLRVVDEDSAVVPEWLKNESAIVRECERPPFFDAYVSVDPAYKKDWTGVLFAHWAFLEHALVIEDELLLKRANTRELAEAIRAKEATLWPNISPYIRVIDDPGERICADFADQFKLRFQSAVKHDREHARSLVRLYVHGQTIAIHPRCVQLIHQLRTAIIHADGDFRRTKDSAHYDLLAALYYLVRTADTHRRHNPYPKGWMPPGTPTHRVKPEPPMQGGPLHRALLSRTAAGRRIILKPRSK